MASFQFDAVHVLDTSNAVGVGSGGSLTLGGGIAISKDVYIGGNMTVLGSTTSFADNFVVVNANPVQTTDTGLLFQRYSQDITNNNNYSSIMYSEVTDEILIGYAQADPQGNSVSLSNLLPFRALSTTLTSTSNSIGPGSGGSLTVLGGSAISKSLVVGLGITTGSLNVTGSGIISTSITTGALNSSSIVATSAQITTLTSTSLAATGNTNTLGNLFTTGGNVGVGTTSPSYALQVVGDVYATGDITSFSDITLKENIHAIDNALEKLDFIRGVTFTRKDTQSNHIGVIAQEIEEVFPELVLTDNKTGLKSVAYGNLVAVLIQCVKELKDKLH
jgi:hypothetical protein